MESNPLIYGKSGPVNFVWLLASVCFMMDGLILHAMIICRRKRSVFDWFVRNVLGRMKTNEFRQVSVGVGDCAHVLNTFVTGSNKTPTGVASNTSSFHVTKNLFTSHLLIMPRVY